MLKQDRQGSRTPAALEMKHRKVLSGTDDTTVEQKSQIAQLERTIAENEDDTHAAIAALRVRVNNLETSVGALNGSDTTIADRLSVVEEDNATQDLILEELVERVFALETAVSGFTERLTALETAITSILARLAALEGTE